MKLPNKVYDVMKWIMFLAVPVGTFILGIIVAVQTGDISAIITAIFGGIGTLAGIIIKVSDNTYQIEQKGGAK